ncbi:MAG: hypothetical protein HYV07_09365 [Deltaproteobacteria bacterium]|nr:hypothetical protein [Deltaproteobacteria bacterium]
MTERARRARARRGRVTLELKPADSADRPILGAKGVELVHVLTLAAYAWSGQQLVRIPRALYPCIFLPGRRT